MAEENISVQQFNRVHLVPRVNQGQAIAIVFELPGVPPVAYGAPVQTLQQLFWRIPQVLFDAKKVRSESGIVDVDPAPAMEVISWPADSVKPSIGLQGQVHLDVHMGACSIQLGFGEKQLQELIKALNALATPIKPIKKASSTPDKKPAKSIVEKKVKSETIKPSAKTQPLKAKVPPRAVTKAKSVKK